MTALGIFLSASFCSAQDAISISEPRLAFNDNILQISYDILSFKPEDRFTINIDIRDDKGKILNASTLNGDIGKNIGGGDNKRISWNLEADSVFMRGYVSVTIHASVIPPPTPVLAAVEPTTPELQEDKPSADPMEKPDRITTDLKKETARPEEKQAIEPEEEQPSEVEAGPAPDRSNTPTESAVPSAKKRGYSRTGVMMQSLPLPGLGLSRATGNPHWLRGLAAYGCVAGAVVYNRKTINSLDEIKTLEDPEAIEETFNRSVQQDKISEVFAYAAIGLWVTDLVWNYFGSSDLRKKPLTVYARPDPLTSAPLISVQFRF